MIFEIELFFPSARPGAAAEVENLGMCKIVSPNIFLSIVEHSGDAHLVPLNDVVSVDVAEHRYTTAHGRTMYPRRIDFPDHFFVETGAGHARSIKGDQIARVT